MFGPTWQTSPRQYDITKLLDVQIPMSDGITIDADIFCPKTEKKVPAILGVHPYSKALQFDAMMPVSMNRTNGQMEAGDANFYARRGYAHVIANNRGTGASGGCYTNYGPREVRDTYEIIEWIAQQPWCDGNVGMFGVSAFAVSQQQVGALKPPHLKALFCPFGYTDFYRDKFYHGGILFNGFLQRWSGKLDNLRYQSWTLPRWGREKYDAAIAQALADEEIAAVPYLADALRRPEQGANAFVVDLLINHLDTDYFTERAVDYSQEPEVPAYLGGDWGMYSLHLPGAFRSWAYWRGPKKLILGPPCYLDRPVYQYANESLRWFDYWLKGMNNGIMDEPPVTLFLMGTGEWRTAADWPLPQTKWTAFYLHENGLLSEHEFWPNEGATTFEDSFMHREGLSFTSPKLVEDTEVIGPIVLNLYASTTGTEVLWFATVYDVGPDDHATLLTRGWLRGSQRELDPHLSKPWLPYHTHKGRQPLSANQIYEFNIDVRPTAQLFRAGHRIEVKIRCVDDEQPQSYTEVVGCGHISRPSSSRITVYHNNDCPSHILLPITKGNIIGTYMSGGDMPASPVGR